MEAFPPSTATNKDLNSVKLESKNGGRHLENLRKRSTVFGTGLENHLDELAVEITTELRVDSVRIDSARFRQDVKR